MSHAELRALNDLNEALRLAGPHRTRPIRFVGPERIGDWRVKIYGIATHGETVRPGLLAETLRRAPDIFPRPAAGGSRHGIGFVIAHDAQTASIALYYWWESYNELHSRVYVGPKDDPTAMTQLPTQVAGCVWELEIIDFERRAWLADVLANPAGPDVERYLARHIDTEI
jgi:hypothetical protein